MTTPFPGATSVSLLDVYPFEAPEASRAGG